MLNHAMHMAAICQIRQTNSEGRIYFERRVDEGKTKKEAIRALKRHISNASTASCSSTSDKRSGRTPRDDSVPA
jgi:hypothetical protein